ncbi:hypothetical protein GW17_00048386 [Ensete ventricosum]|nr:hypothetical protein GW17_00048386 [Ensete ventricosum]
MCLPLHPRGQRVRLPATPNPNHSRPVDTQAEREDNSAFSSNRKRARPDHHVRASLFSPVYLYLYKCCIFNKDVDVSTIPPSSPTPYAFVFFPLLSFRSHFPLPHGLPRFLRFVKKGTGAAMRRPEVEAEAEAG